MTYEARANRAVERRDSASRDRQSHRAGYS